MPTFSRKPRQGFTLIELIIVIAIIAIIAAVVFVAIDPAKRLHASRNSTRWSDVTAILGALKTYQADNNGSYPAAINTGITSNVQIIGEYQGNVGGTSCSASTPACAGLTTGLTVASSSASVCWTPGLTVQLAPYLKKVPRDPSTGVASSTGVTLNSRYYVNVDANGLLSIGACDAEGQGAGGGGTAPTIQVNN